MFIIPLIVWKYNCATIEKICMTSTRISKNYSVEGIVLGSKRESRELQYCREFIP
jgi:hypothetical protein